jgi:hypothetical protein
MSAGDGPYFLPLEALYQRHGIAYLRARQAIKRACCFHPFVSADRRQAASNRAFVNCRTWTGSRDWATFFIGSAALWLWP